MPLGLERVLQGKSKTSFVKWNVETLMWDENVHEILIMITTTMVILYNR